MAFSPFFFLIGTKLPSNVPLLLFNSKNKNIVIDFWGPFSIMSIYSLVLWIGKVRDVPWIYAIWTIAALFNHQISRVWYRSAFMMHISILGDIVFFLINFLYGIDTISQILFFI